MSKPNSTAESLRRSRELLDAGNPDAAIEILREMPESKDRPEAVRTLAEAFFRRGDTKGDLYSAAFFAERALALGLTGNRLHAIRAICAFRKGDYGGAVRAFRAYVTENFPAATRFLFGLSLLRAGFSREALLHLEAAADALPDDAEISAAARQARQAAEDREPETISPPATRSPTLGGVYDRRPSGIATRYPSHALSRLAGTAAMPKDFRWADDSVPCRALCPAGTDIPGYLTAIFEKRYEDAYRINLRDNVFPGVLGRVCARPCEEDCRHGREDLGTSVAICYSKRACADHHSGDGTVVLEPLFPPRESRVAVVGAGVAGLTAARNLALLGHTVTVFERHSAPGGMMVLGIPVFRLPRGVIENEIEQVRTVGVEIRCGVSVGADVSLADLRRDYDAVVLAAGTLRPNLLALPGNELTGIRHGLDFLAEANVSGWAATGTRVVVIGGGFTAMDCARTAKRLAASRPEGVGLQEEAPLTELGRDVTVLYRRSVGEMLVTPGEIEELEREGIPLVELAGPVAYLGDNGRVTGVRFVRNRLGEPDAGGRRRPLAIPGSEFDVPADLVLLATGQFPDCSWIDEGMRDRLAGDDGWLRSGSGFRTDVEGVFVAGDFATGARSLIDAIGHAKNCVRVVDEYLTGEKRLTDTVVIQDDTATGRIREMDAVPVTEMPCLPVCERTLTGEAETGFGPEAAMDEAQRCYRCHYKYEIDPDKCIYCDWCVKAKPRPDCIVKVRELEYGSHGEITGYIPAAGSEDTKLIWINPSSCIRCNACVDACPVDAISIQKVTPGTVTRDGRFGLL